MELDDRMGLMRVRDVCPDVRIDMRYAACDNFFGIRLYDGADAWLLADAARKLGRAANLVAKLGYRLVVLDAYRPLSVQARMWDILPDPDFVAPMSRGSIHNRGAAADVTLADANGVEVAMPSGFDEFSERASHGYAGGDPAALANRDALRHCMEQAGFKSYEAEWWHYIDPECRDSPLLDIPLSRLEALSAQA
ncbi:MAG TPA: M15 family metallopeptidase [bacterium]|nr:M15 family metallopeptidase [bacterium]